MIVPKNYRFPPTRGTAFCVTFVAFSFLVGFGLGGAVDFFTAFAAFFCSFAALSNEINKY